MLIHYFTFMYNTCRKQICLKVCIFIKKLRSIILYILIEIQFIIHFCSTLLHILLLFSCFYSFIYLLICVLSLCFHTQAYFRFTLIFAGVKPTIKTIALKKL